MIVYPQGLIIAEQQDVASEPLTHPRIGYQTYTRELAGTVTVSSELAGAPKDAPLRPETWEYWEPTALPATWEFDLGASPKDVDYVGIAGHTIGSSLASVQVDTKLGAGGWTIFGTVYTPSDDAPLLFLDSMRSVDKVRVTLTGANIPRVAVVYFGRVLKMQRSIYGGHAPITLSRETVLHRSLSKGGQFLGQGFRRHGVKTAASFKYLGASWYRTKFDPFVKAARQYPYFFGWRPQTYPTEVGYVWSDDDIVPSNMGVRDFLQVSWKMQGIGNP